MANSLTLEEAIEAFSNIASTYADPKSIAGDLTRDLDNIAYRLRTLAPQDSGRLRSSIALLASGSTGDVEVILQMLDYGLYQNYGVNGSEGIREIRPLSSTNAPRREPYGVTVANSTLGSYEYSNRRYGLPATVFFDYEQLLNEIAVLAENGIFEAINDNI
jgi:hypothetical protein